MLRQSIRNLLILSSLLAVNLARADKEVARQSFLEGTRLYDVADFNAALEAFKKAYLNYEEPSFLFNIAQCYRQLGNKSEALRFYRTYLRKSPSAPNSDEVHRLMAALETSLAQEKTAASAPPTGTLAPKGGSGEASVAPASPPPAPLHVDSAPSLVASAPPPRPAYRKWWFWTATVGGVAVAAAAIGIGLTLGQSHEVSYQVHAP
jgi:tetratricopeptide (TPR) repeat protein